MSAGSGDLVCATVLTQLVAWQIDLWLWATPTRQQRGDVWPALHEIVLIN